MRSVTTVCKLGIVGCGAIGSWVAKEITAGTIPGIRLVALVDTNLEKVRKLARSLKPAPQVLSLSALAQKADLILEAAGLAAVEGITQAALRAKKDCFILSVGALVEMPEILDAFRRQHCHLHFPSGAVAGLDALKAAAITQGIRRVQLISRKPPRGLAGAPFFTKRKINLDTLTKPTRIFLGSARQAIKLFPANVNVAAAVSLLGIGADRTRMEIIADPAAKRNSHTLIVEGTFGRFTATTENVPSPHNPKTSALAAASALAGLKALVQGDRQGT